MMRFKDFPIKILKEGSWLRDPEGEKVKETLLRINSWVEDQEYIVLNIETLFFPNLNNSGATTGVPTYKIEGGDSSNYYFQVFRVWYKESTPISEKDLDNLV